MIPEPPSPVRGRLLILVGSLVCIALIALADAFTSVDFAIPILYFLPLVIVARLRNATVLWSCALLSVVLAFVLYIVGPSPVSVETGPAALVNRILAIVTILATTAMLNLQLRTERALERHRERLSQQNLETEEANEELEQREEEVVRQNEELQSQTEELERQAEELRLTNEELAARERSLEQLLELSRSITVDLTRDEVMTRVCSSLSILTEGTAAAVLEKRGNSMIVVCHYGFEDGPDRESIPVSETFSSLVLSIGQTAYVEDLRQRKDLRVPQPTRGPEFLSVAGTPIRVGGRAVATLEVYAPAPKAWSEVQIATLESIAAQLSISLQSAELLEEVAEERRRFEAAFRSVPVGMTLLADPEGKEIRVNPAGAALLGVPVDENLSLMRQAGARLRRGLYRDGKLVETNELPGQRVLRGDEIRAEEYEIALADGRRLALIVSGSPFYDAAGRITGGVTAFVDVTLHKRYLRELDLRRREAEEASVRKTRFLAAISHDIRTPANAINLMAELVRRASGDAALAGQIPEMTERLQQNVAVLLALVGDLLDLARFDSGKAEVIETEFPLNEVLKQEGQQLRPLADARGIALTVDVTETPIWLRTDRVKLARIVANLIENAIKFTPSGAVRISVERVSEPEVRVRIHVTDTGIGIAPEHLPRIFDEFIQIRNPERDARKGSGLGLAICKRLVDVLGANIYVSSTPGSGTTFTVELPSSALALRFDSPQIPATPRRDAGESGSANRLRGLRVLVVEDHSVTREGTRDILQQEGASVLVAPDGSAALQMLREHPVDVLILDLMLPDMDGSGILKELERKRPKSLKGVVVLTGDLHEGRLEDLRRFQPDALIQKPVDIEALVSALCTLQRRPPREGSHG